MVEGQIITFHGKADQEYGKDPGDVKIVLLEKDHPVYSRKHSNLVMKCKISLREALCGIDELIVQTLSKERPSIKIKTEPGQVKLPILSDSKIC